MNNTELKVLAQELAMEIWGVAFDFPVIFDKLKRNRYGEYCYRKRKGIYVPRRIAISTEYGFDKPENRDKLVLILKHELCHWYCQVNGMKFGDGERDFETELLKCGALSTHLNVFDEKSLEKSKAIQTEYATGQRTRMGSKAFEYIKEGLSDSEEIQGYEARYRVYYNGSFIGIVRKWNWGKYRWNPDCTFHDYGRTSWTTRKDAVESMKKMAIRKGIIEE